MSEEEKGKMDKKLNPRQCSPQQRNGADSKKDLSKGNQRWGKRRGNCSSGSFNSNEGQGKKPTPQKYKNTWDKRPKPRGELSDNARGDLEDNFEAEYGSALPTGSKKGNLNHLLNFSYGEDDDSYRRRGNNGGARGGGGWGRSRQVRGYRGSNYGRGSKAYYNKEQFLQANCQFVVKVAGDYSAQLLDPDNLVDWDYIEQVRVISPEPPSCPICLDHPTAAKMTRCGHIYCWACILHYLAEGEKKWRKCPICYESVQSDDLKSVVSREVKNYKVGDTITMTRMRKEKGSIYAVPAHTWQRTEGKCHNVQESEELTRHVKLLTATSDQVLTQMEKESDELMVQLALAESSEVPFIKGAQEQLQVKQKSILLRNQRKKAKEAAKDTEESVKVQEEVVVTTLQHSPSDKKMKVYKSAFSDEEDEVEEDTSLAAEPPTDTPAVDVNKDSNSSLGDEKPEDSPTPRASATLDSSDLEEPQEQDSTTPLPNAPRSSSTSETCDTDDIGPPEPTKPLQLLQDALDMMPDALPVDEAAEQLELPTQGDNSGGKKRTKSGESFYFYQSEDGQHIYLHSLNARCLVREYGSLENTPQKITATIVEKESVFVSEELRRRLRYLNHLPLTCSFDVVELDLRPPLVGKDTLKHFSEEIEKRRRLRQRKNRDEKRMSRRIEADERKKFGLSDSTIIPSQFGRPNNIPSERRLSETRSDTSSPSLDTPVGSPGMYATAYQSMGGVGQTVSEDGSQSSVISFAQMMKTGTKAPVWPSKKSPNMVSPGTSRPRRDSDESDEDKIPVPEYHSSFGSAIEAALVNIDSRTDQADSSNKASGGNNKSSGKKKKKQLVLFSTSMARGGAK